MFALISTAQTGSTSPGAERWKRLRYGTTAAGSAYVPMDSWIYSAFDRLIAWGYIDSEYLDLRPWTRLSCVRMLARAEDIEPDRRDPEAQKLYLALRKEFEPDYRAATEDPPKLHAELDSVYERSLGIAGPPINDSFHFGQTIINDYGRPFQEGLNQIAGFTGRAEYGRFSLSVRGEYQYAPGRSAYSDSVREAIAAMDTNPLLPAASIPASKTFRLLDANLSANLAGNEISIGKSELWWGPGQGGAFAYSNNSEPIYMLRINRVEPLLVPWVSKLLGPVRYDLFLGSLKGHISPPWALDPRPKDQLQTHSQF
ncbi:MAG: capsule assembly Wzi family protein [Bryobacteraceae bacterium]